MLLFMTVDDSRTDSSVLESMKAKLCSSSLEKKYVEKPLKIKDKIV